jgi:hypothetical protein
VPKSKLESSLILFTVIFLLLLTINPRFSLAVEMQLREGSTLFYKGIRGSRFGGYQTWDASINILTLNQTALIFQSSFTFEGSTEGSKVTVKYENGFPSYADYFTALIYLPPECIAETLQGKLEWTSEVDTLYYFTEIMNKTIQASDFTVEAGTFQGVNITLTVADASLTYIYDVNSGILLYEHWFPNYGDQIILELMATTYTAEKQIALNLILSTATLVTPVAITIHQTRNILGERRHKRGQRSKETRIKSGFPQKPFYIILAGAILNLVSVFLPWSQFAELQIYLPLSLLSALVESAESFTLTGTFVMTSLIAHSTAILAWLSIAMHLYTKKKLTSQMATLISSILAFTSALIFIQTGWTSSWGLPLTVMGGILTITGVVIANVKIEIITEEPEESEDTSSPL